jgi:hypothetical protein
MLQRTEVVRISHKGKANEAKAVIMFTALPEAKDNPAPGYFRSDRLQRRCHFCQHDSIIGHERQLRQAHDDLRERI